MTTTAKEPLAPAEAKQQHEDSALAMLCAELTAQGRPARVVEHPDRQPGSPLTVDAILDIDGERWAVDHCLLSRARTLPTAMSVAEKNLLPSLQNLADRYGVGLYVSYLPQAVEPSRKARKANGIGAYYENLLAQAEQSARSGEAYLGEDGMAQVHPVRDGWIGDRPPVVLAPFTNTTGSIRIGDEVAAGLREPLLKKVDHQFRPARGLGLKTMLLLDQIPRPGGGHTVWIASPALVASTVTAILADAGALDAIHEAWLRQPPWGDDPPRTCRLVLGNPPD